MKDEVIRMVKTKVSELPDWWLFKCGCEVFVTDYPFVDCTRCGYKTTQMKLLASGKDFDWNYTKQLEKHKLESIRVEFHHGMAIDNPNDYFDDEYGDDEFEWL